MAGLTVLMIGFDMNGLNSETARIEMIIAFNLYLGSILDSRDVAWKEYVYAREKYLQLSCMERGTPYVPCNTYLYDKPTYLHS